jgi:phosphate transport system protein
VESVYESALVNYLVSMARTVESALEGSIHALLAQDEKQASAVFLLEPRINEMEILIDEHAVRLLRSLPGDGGIPRPANGHAEETIRLVVSTLRINNDLERMGDMAVNIAQRVLALSKLKDVAAPDELQPMCGAVRAMVAKIMGALIHRNVSLALEVLESEDAVDGYRDRIFERLLAQAAGTPSHVASSLLYILASRHLERVADHATNIAEDVLYWVRGLDVRHGQAAELFRKPVPSAERSPED